jgi:hypothetical protein
MNNNIILLLLSPLTGRDFYTFHALTDFISNKIQPFLRKNIFRLISLAFPFNHFKTLDVILQFLLQKKTCPGKMIPPQVYMEGNIKEGRIIPPGMVLSTSTYRDHDGDV